MAAVRWLAGESATVFSPAALAVVSGLLVSTLVGVAGVCRLSVGPEWLRVLRTRPPWFRRRLREVAPYIAALGVVVVLNKGLQGPIRRVSSTYGIEATPILYGIEGDLVHTVQALTPDPALIYFAAVYTVGYAVVLFAPLVIYLFAERACPLKWLVTSYTITYAVAVGWYAAVVAYGPRNVDRSTEAAAAGSPLLELVPEITVVTSLVNSNTNVFPSLHAALSVTVGLIAASTRAAFRRWFYLAAWLAASILAATLALGIHWVSDVVAGGVLAVFAVGGGRWVVDR
ncbi:phosphatase PAP2 family protein [Halohasta salina]|uniref:phosphatase PAP2 family protein n=1 Tax=Halohasta salina TaxID=2961621 RepID=UPI0020A4EF7E|nr:phosphatase PAP2 family protein [Halohasta salina]